MDLREIPLEILFEKLKNKGIILNREEFEVLSWDYETPESMAAELAPHDGTLLPHFLELWRRLCPERQSVSVFGFHIDHLMTLYENGMLKEKEDLADALAFLQNLLDENVDRKINVKEAVAIIQEYLSHHLETFIYIYILNEIEDGHTTYALELIEGFRPYMDEQVWFDYLAARAFLVQDPEVGYEKFEKLIRDLEFGISPPESEEEEGSGKPFKTTHYLDLELELLSFLAESGHHCLFHSLALKTILHLETEEDLLDFGQLCEEHFHNLPLESMAIQIKELFNNRTPRLPTSPLIPTDPDLMQLHRVLNQKILEPFI